MSDEPTQQAERVIVGHCPKCDRVLVLLNNHEQWALFRCECGWAGATTGIKNRHRLDRGGYVEGDPRIDERSARVEMPEPMRGPMVEVIGDYLEQQEHGIMRCEYEVLGGHVHCRVFGPYSGKAGDLVFRVEEWEHFQRTHPGWQFRDRTPSPS